ncbi:P63C domain-containing protein [Kordia sp.]|uniref:P63C domain-containing protein n=1 Tax=Kordia sp. TaxID=1965332 RepID=UPI003B593A00
MAKKLKATHQGELDLNGFELTCAVLDDEDRTRVFSERTIANAFGIKGGGAYWKKKKEGSAVLPEYLSASYLKPFISKELKEEFENAYSYRSLSGVDSNGVDVTVLPEICDVYIQARNSGKDSANLVNAAEIAYALMKGFATVGIVALVDEATGYQYDREKDELQKILQKYISQELLPWQKRFPDIFYKELFRLNGWDFTVNGIKKRPGVIGTWTKKLVYEQLPKGVLEELEKNVPKSETGNKTARFHQLLTDDIGNPHLTAQINQIVTLFQLSDNMKHMWEQFEKLKHRQSGQLALPFNFDDKGRTIEPTEETELSDFNKNLLKAVNTNPKDDKK